MQPQHLQVHRGHDLEERVHDQVHLRVREVPRRGLVLQRLVVDLAHAQVLPQLVDLATAQVLPHLVDLASAQVLPRLVDLATAQVPRRLRHLDQVLRRVVVQVVQVEERLREDRYVRRLGQP